MAALPRGGRFLEIGCGTGATAVIAAQSGCRRAVALGISAAVANTRRIIGRHGVGNRVTVLRSDLFAAPDPAGRLRLRPAAGRTKPDAGTRGPEEGPEPGSRCGGEPA